MKDRVRASSMDVRELIHNGSAIRVLAKTLTLAAVSICLIRNSPHWSATLLGVVMQGVAMSWLYMVGLDCAGEAFFSKGAINEIIGTVALAPLLRPLFVLRDKGNQSRALIYQLVDSVVGISVSHLAVDAFLLVAIPFLYFKLGLWGIMKYWLLPLVIAHLNAGSFLKQATSSAFLFPELGDSVRAPLYALENWIPKQVVPSASWQSPLWPATREFLLWRRRDWVLHIVLLAGGIFSLISVTQSWAPLLPLLAVPLLAWQSQAAKKVREVATSSVKSKKTLEFSVDELWARPDLAAVENIVFDLERFSEVHPGGNLIRACGGTDCTGVFGSMHAFTAEKNLAKLRDFQVGTLKSSDIQFDMRSQFAIDAKAAMLQALKGVSMYAPIGWWVRTALICCATLTFEVYWAVSGLWWAAVVVGVLHAMIGICVQHDGSHGAISKKPWVNALFAYGADWIGSNRWLWFQQHIIGHHPHCNIESADPDAHSAEPLLQFHWLGEGKLVKGFRGWLLAHQHLYMYLVLPWYGPTVIYNLPQLVTMSHGDETPSSAWMMAKRPVAVLARLFYLFRIVFLPAFLSGASWWTAALLVPLVTGFVLTFVFLVSHNFQQSDRAPLSKDGTPTDFYKLQVETSCSYGGNLAMILSGGLNMQIEHHVMPRLNSWHYPRVQAALRQVCEKHNVRYVYFPSLWSNVMDTIAYMRAAGQHASSTNVEDAGASRGASSKVEIVPPLKVVLHGRMVDLTRWVPRHPGGEEVMRIFENRDATEQFLAMHSEAANRKLAQMLVGAPMVDSAVAQTPAAVAYAKLRDELKAEGMFEASRVGEAWRLAQNLSWYLAGFLVMRFTSYSWTGAFLYAWGMQQSGWLSHDYLHHGVFKSVPLNDWMGAALGWLQGYDSEWWKDRHNLHHVATNEEGHDPDIDLAPLLTFVNNHVSLNAVQRFQHIYFIPLLSLLHFSWCFSSMRFTIARRLWVQTAALILNHFFAVFVVYRSPGGDFLLTPLLVSYLFKGMLTALFVFSTHYPEIRLPKGARSMSLMEQTAHTSRNIGGGWLVDWMSGGISRQIEHHLFPMLPRERLVHIAPRVRKLFKQLNLPYVETSIAECMVANVQCLLWKREIAAKSESL